MTLRNNTINFKAANTSPVREQKQHDFYLRALLTLALIVGVVASAPAFAATLDTSGPLQLPGNCPGSGCGNGQPGVYPNVVNNSGNFTGTWPSGVDAGYGGQFTGTGLYPGKNGTDNFNFTTLTHGSLQAGTMMEFGDLDDGSGPEKFTIQAFDSSHSLIQSAWLQDAFYVSGSNPGDFVQGSMPEYKWTSGTGTYLFDGANVVGNPTIGVWLTTNSDISYLTVSSNTDFASFAIAAPTPEPGSLFLMGSGVVFLGGMLRRKFLC